MAIEQDIWHPLKAFTAARIALGRTGTAIPLKEVLAFKLAFAYAKDAVYSALMWYRFSEFVPLSKKQKLCVLSASYVLKKIVYVFKLLCVES